MHMTISFWQIFVILAMAGVVMGFIRSINNRAWLHLILSMFVPLYGLVHIFATRRPE